jgi:hypothetical protein
MTYCVISAFAAASKARGSASTQGWLKNMEVSKFYDTVGFS